MQSATTRTPEFSDSSSETRSSSQSTSLSVGRHSSQISDTATRSSQPEGPRVAIASVNRQGMVRMIENDRHNRHSWVENSEHGVQDQPAATPTDEQLRASFFTSRRYPGIYEFPFTVLKILFMIVTAYYHKSLIFIWAT